MRILLVVPQDEEIGGVATVVGNLARYLTTRGHQVFFFHPSAGLCLEQRINRLGFRGFYLRLQMPFGERHPVISVLTFTLLFPIAAFQLLLLLRRYKIDIVNVHYPADCFVYFALCRQFFGGILVTSVHGADVFPGGRSASHSRSFEYTMSSSDAIVTPSNQFKKDFTAGFPELSDKLTFIHNGIDLDEIDNLATRDASENRAPYILCVSAYKEQKAIDVLIRAFKLLRETNPLVRLIIVGAGDLREKLERLADDLGLQVGIQFLGAMARAEVFRLMRGCELFVLPSRFETFGIVIIEAMAHEKPVVATLVGGIPEIIQSGKNGILVEPDNPGSLAEAIVTVLQNRELRSSLAREAYVAVCKRFRTEHNGAAYEAVFAGLLTRQKDPARSPSTSAGRL
jgi:glycosyltransferase involved in cell wall biosynthesis